MKPRAGLRYEDVGVLTNEELGLDALLGSVRQTEAFRQGKGAGRSILDIGYFANVIDLGHGIGLAMTTDGVGTKVMVAEAVERYDTIGIDCVAMNVNDLICVGAEPVSMLDYIGIERSDPHVLEQIGVGLLEGARQAGINIVGGEISQMKEMLKGVRPDRGLDLVGMCIGLVATDKVNTGQDVRPGDLVMGLSSTGIHSNGLTLARNAMLGTGKMELGQYVGELGKNLGDELLTPTRIYVKEILALLDGGLPIKAMVNITSDGLLNLCRIRPAVSFRLHTLPRPQPVFELIQRTGGIDDAEMYRVFNMGVGFCIIVPPDSGVVESVKTTIRSFGGDCSVIGEVFDDDRRRVELPQRNLVGQGDRFEPVR